MLAIGRRTWGVLAGIAIIAIAMTIMLIYHRTPSYNPKLGWIEIVGPGASTRYFVVTNQRCTPYQSRPSVGYNTMGGGVLANVLPTGTRVYSIKGVNPEKALAVELNVYTANKPTVYVEAYYAGVKEPH